MTFEPHPMSVLRNEEVRRLGSLSDKIYYLSFINILFLLRFNKEFSAQSAEQFASLLFDGLGAKYVLVGENFRFGKGRVGDVELLRREGGKRGAEVEGEPLQIANGEAISSGRIRDCLRQGDFVLAQELLGRPWMLRGRVVRGRGLGKTLGFPTINLNLNFLPVCEGIFAAAAYLHDDFGDKQGGAVKAVPAALSIGKNPTVGGESLKIEAHLLDFEGDLYGRRLSLRPLCKIREEQKFTDMQVLQAAIEDDIVQIRQYWQTSGLSDSLAPG